MSGGAQRQIVVLANELHRRGYGVEILTYYAGDQLSQFLRSAEIRHEVVPRRGRFDLAFPVRLHRHLRRRRPDCIISYLTTPNFWASTVGRMAGVKRVITSERSMRRARRGGLVRLDTLLSRASSCIVVNSQETRRNLMAEGVRGDRIEVIYNGVDLVQFARCTDEQIAACRRSLGVAPEDFLILLPGRMSEEKNHLLLIQALQGLDVTTMCIQVAFAGNEPYPRFKEQVVHETQRAGLLERVRFLGPRSDIPLLYGAADVVVLPSVREGFPNVVVEAMVCETPVVVSDISDNRVIVEHGSSGYVFASGSSGELAAALDSIFRMTRSERRTMGRRGAQRVRALCSLEAFGDRYEALIEGTAPAQTDDATVEVKVF